jgi:hypothetical protein
MEEIDYSIFGSLVCVLEPGRSTLGCNDVQQEPERLLDAEMAKATLNEVVQEAKAKG